MVMNRKLALFLNVKTEYKADKLDLHYYPKKKALSKEVCLIFINLH